MGLFVILDPDIATEPHDLRILRTLEFKRITISQPVIRDLDLVAVLDLLPEHTIAVADAAAVRRIAKRCERIKEAGGETAEAAVAKRRVRFLVLDHVQIEAHLRERLLHLLVGGEVDQIVAERPAHQEFHRHVVEDLRILFVHHLLGRHPVVDDDILDRVRHRLEKLLLRRFLQSFAKQIADIVPDRFLEPFLIKMLIHAASLRLS